MPTDNKILTSMTKEEFLKAFTNNEGALILKFGAEWCGPCKKIEGLVKALMMQTPESMDFLNPRNSLMVFQQYLHLRRVIRVEDQMM